MAVAKRLESANYLPSISTQSIGTSNTATKGTR